MDEAVYLSMLRLMAIIENRSYFDTLEDKAGGLLKEIDPHAKQTPYRLSKKRLRDYILENEGAEFWFRKERMALAGSNDSVLIKIGQNKRGHLAAFRGHWVRVIWFSTYGFSMGCLVQKVKVPKEVEAKLIPRGPYTKEEFYAGIDRTCPDTQVVVDGVRLVRSTKGEWVSIIPSEAALRNETKDDIPDGIRYQATEPIPSSTYSCHVHYLKHDGKWLRLRATADEFAAGACQHLPLGVWVVVYDPATRREAYKTRTTDGWK